MYVLLGSSCSTWGKRFHTCQGRCRW